MMKIDYKKKLASLYGAKVGVFVIVEVPVLQFVKVDGYGDPNVETSYQQAVEWLFSVSYALKFGHKSREGTDYVVPRWRACGGPTIPGTSSIVVKNDGTGP